MKFVKIFPLEKTRYMVAICTAFIAIIDVQCYHHNNYYSLSQYNIPYHDYDVLSHYCYMYIYRHTCSCRNLANFMGIANHVQNVMFSFMGRVILEVLSTD